MLEKRKENEKKRIKISKNFWEEWNKRARINFALAFPDEKLKVVDLRQYFLTMTDKIQHSLLLPDEMTTLEHFACYQRFERTFGDEKD